MSADTTTPDPQQPDLAQTVGPPATLTPGGTDPEPTSGNLTELSGSFHQTLAHGLAGWLSDGATYVAGAAIAYVLSGGAPPINTSWLGAMRNPLIALGSAVLVVVVLSLLAVYISRQIGTTWLVSRRTFARVVQFLAHKILSTAGGIILGLIAGTQGQLSALHLDQLLTGHPAAGIAILALFLVIIMLSPLFPVEPEPAGPATTRRQRRVLTATAISVVSSLLFVSLLLLVLSQPSWCPSSICPVFFDANGVHDDNFEAVYKTTQSAAFVLPGDPAQYTLTNAPHQVPAVLTTAQSGPYRVVVHVDNRQRNGTYSIIVEQVALVIDNTTSPPDPLNVYLAGSNLDYRTEPYLVAYHGEPAGTTLSAEYVPFPGSHVQLEPGGADELDIQITSKVAADVRFHVRVTYRVANEPDEHTLTLPNQFEVVYGDATNWNSYIVGPDGRLAPQP